MAGLGKYTKGAKFTLKTGNSPMFKMVGSSPTKHYVDDMPDHNDGHSDALQTPEEHEAGKIESPAKQGLIWNEDIKKELEKTFKSVSDTSAVDKFQPEIEWKPGLKRAPKRKKKSPVEQTDTTYADRTKKSKREQDFAERYTAEKAKDKYWYKINNKAATKAQYMAYKNKPGGDEPGKQTNDPTVSLAKQSANKRK